MIYNKFLMGLKKFVVVRFYFTDQTRVSSTTGGENSVVQMIGSLYDAIESDYGSLATRLYRAFKPKPCKYKNTYLFLNVFQLWSFYVKLVYPKSTYSNKCVNEHQQTKYC